MKSSPLLGLRFSNAFAGLAGAVLFGIAALPNAQAKYLECPNIRLDKGDKVVVGDLGITAGTDAIAAKINQTRLKNALWQRLSDLVASEGGEIDVTECPPGHEPEKADFKPQFVTGIFASGVLLEVWALATQDEAQIDYALVPLLPPIGSGQKPDGFYSITYSLSPNTGLKKIFDDSLELRAFTLLGAGLRALADARSPTPTDTAGYGKAYKVLCRAHDFLLQAEQHPGGDGLPPTEWAALQGLALSSANAAGAKTPTLQGVTLKDCVVAPPAPPPQGGPPP